MGTTTRNNNNNNMEAALRAKYTPSEEEVNEAKRDGYYADPEECGWGATYIQWIMWTINRNKAATPEHVEDVRKVLCDPELTSHEARIRGAMCLDAAAHYMSEAPLDEWLGAVRPDPARSTSAHITEVLTRAERTFE